MDWKRIPLLAGLIVPLAAAPASSKALTFHQDVEPILQARCQSCHHPGDIGPMPLLTYQHVRPWAKAIRAAVLQKKMPPWFADPRYGEFLNNRSLPQSEIDTLVNWVDSGAQEGDSKDAPQPLAFSSDWHIGKPDAIVELPKPFQVPAAGTIPYQYVRVPTGFTEDKWVTAVEVQPGNRQVIHHMNAAAIPPGSALAKMMPVGEYIPLDNEASNRALIKAGKEPPMFAGGTEGELLEVFVPGTVAKPLLPGQARLIRAGSDLMLQIHFTPDGKPDEDRSRVGFVFARQPPEERIRGTLVYNVHFTIPAGASDHRVQARAVLKEDVKLVSLLPHMHVRGKDFLFRAVYPSGESEVLLSVPNYDFHWQINYYLKTPKLLPKGTLLECVGHFDNSPNNPSNPNPKVDVSYGEQTWEEMLNGFMEVAIDPRIPTPELFASAPATSAALVNR
ncbi:MAG TPA: hypothetical protein VKG25_22375 [Bryobacteraceae bacterium]|nr:hypothetical protein [Bryobacteraceae bacterium]